LADSYSSNCFTAAFYATAGICWNTRLFTTPAAAARLTRQLRLSRYKKLSRNIERALVIFCRRSFEYAYGAERSVAVYQRNIDWVAGYSRNARHFWKLNIYEDVAISAFVAALALLYARR
jgi:hypothetical protein